MNIYLIIGGIILAALLGIAGYIFYMRKQIVEAVQAQARGEAPKPGSPAAEISDALKTKISRLPAVQRLQAKYGMRMTRLEEVRKLQAQKLSPMEFMKALETIPQVKVLQEEMQKKVMELPEVVDLQEQLSKE